jgi:translation elongation factor EF-4
MAAGAPDASIQNHLTRRANHRHDSIMAARVTGAPLPNSSKPARSNLTPKRKLLEMQKEGVKMRQFGKVDIPQEALIAALKVDS